MQLLMGLVAAALFVISTNIWASECPVSTTPRALFSGIANVAKERFDPEKGEYSATLKDGSSVTVRFNLCGLGIRASYLVEREDDDLSKYIKLLLMSLIGSENNSNMIGSQLAEHTEEEFRSGVTLRGHNGDHWIQVKDSQSPIYETVIHYLWIPPEH